MSQTGVNAEDAEDAVAIGDIHVDIETRHETEQAALTTVVGIADCAKLVEIRLAQDDASDLAAVKTHEDQQVNMNLYCALMDCSKRP